MGAQRFANLRKYLGRSVGTRVVDFCRIRGGITTDTR
jgi:hypothetical protein